MHTNKKKRNEIKNLKFHEGNSILTICFNVLLISFGHLFFVVVVVVSFVFVSC